MDLRGASSGGSYGGQEKLDNPLHIPLNRLPAQSKRTGAIALCSWTPEESQVESCEHQDNANIHCQPLPESVFEEHEIYTDYDGYHRNDVKHQSYLSAHFS